MSGISSDLIFSTGTTIRGGGKPWYPEAYFSDNTSTLSWNSANGHMSTNWKELTTIQPGSMNVTVERNVYDLMLGHPSTQKDAFVIGMTGTVSFVPIEFVGNYELSRIMSGGETPTITGSTSTTVTGSTSTTTSVVVTDATSIVEGAILKLQLSVLGSTKYEYPVVTDVTGTTLTVSPALSQAPIGGDTVQMIDDWRQYIGGTNIPYTAVKTIMRTSDGYKCIYFMHKCRSLGSVNLGATDGQKEAEETAEFSMFSKSVTIGTASKPILAEKRVVPPSDTTTHG